MIDQVELKVLSRATTRDIHHDGPLIITTAAQVDVGTDSRISYRSHGSLCRAATVKPIWAERGIVILGVKKLDELSLVPVSLGLLWLGRRPPIHAT